MTLRLNALHIAVAGDHPGHAAVLLDEADDLADRPAADRRDVAERTVADRFELDRVVERRAVGRDEDEMSSTVDVRPVAAAIPRASMNGLIARVLSGIRRP
jgi:hypothetical protein